MEAKLTRQQKSILVKLAGGGHIEDGGGVVMLVHGHKTSDLRKQTLDILCQRGLVHFISTNAGTGNYDITDAGRRLINK